MNKSPKVIIFALSVLVLGAAAYLWQTFYYEKEPFKFSFPAVLESPTGAIYTYMKENGIDKKYGLDVDFVWTSPGDTDSRTLRNEFLMGHTTVSELAKAYASGNSRLKIVGTSFFAPNAIQVRASSPYSKIDDVRGKLIGTFPKSAGGFSVFAVILSDLGYNIENDFRLTFGAPVQLSDFLKQGVVEASVFVDPQGTTGVARGEFRRILDFNESWKAKHKTNLPSVAIVADGQWLDASWRNKVRARNFLKAVNESVSALRSDPGLMDEFLKKTFKLNDGEELRLARESVLKLMNEKWDDDIRNSMVDFSKALAENNFVPAPLPEEAFLEL